MSTNQYGRHSAVRYGTHARWFPAIFELCPTMPDATKMLLEECNKNRPDFLRIVDGNGVIVKRVYVT